MRPSPIISFRRRLTQLVSTTDWAHQADTPERVKEIAAALGIAEDILAAARRLVVDGLKTRGLKASLTGVKINERYWPQLEILMPERIFNDWQSWCESQHAKSSALLRGIIHAYLLGSWEPAWIASFWRYRGETLPMKLRAHRELNEGAWPWRERVLVTPGARGALNFRAKSSATTAMAITRGLVLEILEGRYKNVIPRDALSMFDDPLRYRR